MRFKSPSHSLLILVTFSTLASVSTYTWQIPSLWPITGIPLAAFWIFLTSCDEPRGMMRSISLSKRQRSSTSSLVFTCGSCNTKSLQFYLSGFAHTFYTNHSKEIVDLTLSTYQLHCISDSVNRECFLCQMMKDLIAMCCLFPSFK